MQLKQKLAVIGQEANKHNGSGAHAALLLICDGGRVAI